MAMRRPASKPPSAPPLMHRATLRPSTAVPPIRAAVRAVVASHGVAPPPRGAHSASALPLMQPAVLRVPVVNRVRRRLPRAAQERAAGTSSPSPSAVAPTRIAARSMTTAPTGRSAAGTAAGRLSRPSVPRQPASASAHSRGFPPGSSSDHGDVEGPQPTPGLLTYTVAGAKTASGRRDAR